MCHTSLLTRVSTDSNTRSTCKTASMHMHSNTSTHVARYSAAPHLSGSGPVISPRCHASPPQLNLFMVRCKKAGCPAASNCSIPASCHPAVFCCVALTSRLLLRHVSAAPGGTCAGVERGEADEPKMEYGCMLHNKGCSKWAAVTPRQRSTWRTCMDANNKAQQVERMQRTLACRFIITCCSK